LHFGKKQRGKLPDSTKVFKGSFGEVSFLALKKLVQLEMILENGRGQAAGFFQKVTEL
jgi:hypothetical protein